MQVGRGHLGELTVDFGTYGWFPSRLPSEGAEGSEDEEDDEDEEDGEERGDGRGES